MTDELSHLRPLVDAGREIGREVASHVIREFFRPAQEHAPPAPVPSLRLPRYREVDGCAWCAIAEHLNNARLFLSWTLDYPQFTRVYVGIKARQHLEDARALSIVSGRDFSDMPYVIGGLQLRLLAHLDPADIELLIADLSDAILVCQAQAQAPPRPQGDDRGYRPIARDP